VRRTAEPSFPLTTADVTGVSKSAFERRVSESSETGTPRMVPDSFPEPARSFRFSSDLNDRHPWTTWPETGPASKATPTRYSVSRSLRSCWSWKSSCPTW